jgi:hypothetical protein
LIEKTYGVRPELSAEAETERNDLLLMEKWSVINNHYAYLYGICKDLKCLPRAGGLDDQDWILVQAFGIIGQEMSKLKSRMMDHDS